MIRIVYMLILLSIIIGCKRDIKEVKNSNSTSSSNALRENSIMMKEVQKSKISDSLLKAKQEFRFDRTKIPAHLINYIELNIDSLRIPNDDDYELDYYSSCGGNIAPFFCSGYFNNDTLIDYAMVLIKDSTQHYVFSFHQTGSSYKANIMLNGPFMSEYGKDKKYAAFDLRTEKDRELQAIDTLYRTENDGIWVGILVESRSFLQVWNNKTNRYENLVFD